MIRASLIYTAVTILLALVDAIRIKKAKGVVENINHKVSVVLAATAIVIINLFYGVRNPNVGLVITDWSCLILAFASLRFALYDPLLNLARRMKIDYESPTTSSYVDNHTTLITFWEKRAIGLAGWGVMVFVHYIIFKTA